MKRNQMRPQVCAELHPEIYQLMQERAAQEMMSMAALVREILYAEFKPPGMKLPPIREYSKFANEERISDCLDRSTEKRELPTARDGAVE
jgi:hypothetical protein